MAENNKFKNVRSDSLEKNFKNLLCSKILQVQIGNPEFSNHSRDQELARKIRRFELPTLLLREQ